MRRIALSLALIATTLVAGTHGWWCVGHMVIAEIARKNLVPGVQAKVDAQFAYLHQWFNQTSTMVDGACWADDIKSHKLYAMAGWHFIDQIYNPDNVSLTSDPQKENVAAEIKELQGTLKEQWATDAWINAFATANLVHFYGDIHQPLHATDRYSAEFPQGDRGGNEIKVKLGDKDWNLHAIWDSVCGQYDKEPDRPLSEQGSSYISGLATDFVNNFTVPSIEKSVYNATVMAQESYQTAVEFAYANNTIKDGQTLSADYIAKCKQAAGSRITYAGMRLASELNFLFRGETSGRHHLLIKRLRGIMAPGARK